MNEILDAAVQLLQLMGLLSVIAMNLGMFGTLKRIEDKLNK
jgi:hypothetical protein